MVMRPQAYSLISTHHGSMIVNRFDYHMIDNDTGYGVGWQIMNTGEYDMQEVSFVKFLLEQRLANYGKGAVAIDCGANIGVHTIEWAKMLFGKGSVVAFEPQEYVYYALCGNIALNNCFNVSAYNSAVGDENKLIDMPKPNYFKPSSFGSMEIKQHDRSENIGQALTTTTKVEQVVLDALPLQRVDFIKIDVEGMEFEALAGGSELIEKFKPQMLIEIIKIDKEKMREKLVTMGYDVYPFGGNFFAVHKSDKMADKCSLVDGNLRIG